MAKKENVKKEEVKVEDVKVEEVKAADEITPVEETPMEMTMTMDGEELMGEIEEVVAEKVKQEEIDNKANKHKRGPKEGSTNKAKEGKEPKEPKKKEINLSDLNVIQREIKKGRISAPQGRIEKDENSSQYILKLADGVIFSKDAKENMKEFAQNKVMNDAKYEVTLEAVKRLGNVDKFKAQHENGQEVEHNYVRVELHKPGRDKDVVMLFTTSEAKNHMRIVNEKAKRKEEDDKKKAEREAKKKADELKAKEEALKEAAKKEKEDKVV